MAFLGAVIQTLFKLIVVAAVAFGGIVLGKFLRDKKNNENE